MKNNSSEISFYRLTTLPIMKAAPKLIEKIYYSGQRLVVIVENDAMMKIIDDGLWAYSTKHFIPHATKLDDHKENQPVYITDAFENPNNAKIIMIVGQIELTDIVADKLIHLFDGNDQKQLEFARKKWKSYQNAGNILTYWQQNMDGAWEKVNNEK